VFRVKMSSAKPRLLDSITRNPSAIMGFACACQAMNNPSSELPSRTLVDNPRSWLSPPHDANAAPTRARNRADPGGRHWASRSASCVPGSAARARRYRNTTTHLPQANEPSGTNRYRRPRAAVNEGLQYRLTVSVAARPLRMWHMEAWRGYGQAAEMCADARQETDPRYMADFEQSCHSACL